MEAAAPDLLAPGRLLAALKGVRVGLEKVLAAQSQSAPQDQPPSSAQAASPAVDFVALTEAKKDLVNAFFVLYRAQALEEEVSEINGIIKLISTNLVNLPGPSGDTNPDTDVFPSLQYLLVVAQLTLVCALQQTAQLIPRDAKATALGGAETAWNSLPQAPGSREGLDGEYWSCFGAKAFSCLAYAVFRQPEVDSERAGYADVEWFMHEACLLRAYSYIRLCMLPVLQAAASHDSYVSLYLHSVLSDLLHNIAHIFTLSIYTQGDSTTFPHLFVPSSAAFFHHNQQHYAEVRQEDAHAKDYHIEEVDTLEDVLLCLQTFATMFPRFATHFFPAAPASRRDLFTTETALAGPSASVHPFLARVLATSSADVSLALSATAFLTALCTSAAHARHLHAMLGRARHAYLRVDWIADKIDVVLRQLAPEPAPAPTGTRPVAALPTHLGAVDLPAINAFLLLLEGLCKDAEVAAGLQAQFQLVYKLSALLASPVPPEVKGSAWKGLAGLAAHTELREEVWRGVDGLQLVPHTRSTLSSPGVGFAPAHRGGLRAEVEEVEARMGTFFILDGFLLCMRSLFQAPVPQGVYGLPYIDFVLDEVVCRWEKLHIPEAAPAMQAQRFKLLARGLEVLCACLQHYPLHQVSLPLPVHLPPPSDETVPDALSSCLRDFRELNTAHVFKKHPGWHVLAHLLRNHKVTSVVLGVLALSTTDLPAQLLQDQFHSEAARCATCLRSHLGVSVFTQGSSYRAHRGLARAGRLFEDHRAPLATSQRSAVECDAFAFLQRCVAAALALLNEAALRSAPAVALQQALNHASPLNMYACSSAYVEERVPVLLHCLGDILKGHRFESVCLFVLTHPSPGVPSNPTPQALAVDLLRFLAMHQVQHVYVFEDVSAADARAVAQLLTRGDDDGEDAVVGEDGAYHVAALGGEARPAQYPRASMYQNSEQGGRESVREALAHMLLAALVPQRVCMAHCLLGLRAGGLGEGLDALIDVASARPALLERNPRLAMDVFELLQRLGSDSVTAPRALGRLRETDFVATLLERVYALLQMDAAEAARRAEQLDASVLAYRYPVQELQAAACVCMAHLLRLGAAELHASLSGRASVGQYSGAQRLLRFLLLPSTSGAGALPLAQLHECIHRALAAATEPSREPLGASLRGALLQAAREAPLTKAGTGYGAANPYPPQGPPALFIDVVALLQLLGGAGLSGHEAQVRDTVQRAVRVNLDQSLRAAGAHATIAMARLLDLVASLYAQHERHMFLLDSALGASAETVLLHEVLLGTVRALGPAQTLGAFAAEQLAFALAGLAGALHGRYQQRAFALTESSAATLLDTLAALAQTLAAPNSQALALSVQIDLRAAAEPSRAFQGIVGMAITHVVQSLLLLASAEPAAWTCVLPSALATLERVGAPLVAALAAQSVSAGPKSWRLAGLGACTALVHLLQVTGAAHGAFATKVFPAALQALKPALRELAAEASSLAEGGPAELELLRGGLRLLGRASALPTCADFLQSLQLVPRLCAVQRFDLLPHCRDQLYAAGAGSGAGAQAGPAPLLLTLHASVQLLFALVTAAPLSVHNPAALAQFVRLNRSALSHLLRLREPSLPGLGCLHTTLALLLAGSRSVVAQRVRAEGLRDAAFVGDLLALLPDLNALLRAFGAGLLPGAVCAHFRMRAPQGDSPLWAQLSAAAPADDDEARLAGQLAAEHGWDDTPASWSARQQAQLLAVGQSLLALTGLLRCVAVHLAPAGRDAAEAGTGTRGVDLEALVRVLALCVQLSCALDGGAGGRPEETFLAAGAARPGARQSLRKYLAALAQLGAANAVHVLQVALPRLAAQERGQAQGQGVAAALAAQVVALAEQLPASSAVALAARVLGDQVEAAGAAALAPPLLLLERGV